MRGGIKKEEEEEEDRSLIDNGWADFYYTNRMVFTSNEIRKHFCLPLCDDIR